MNYITVNHLRNKLVDSAGLTIVTDQFTNDIALANEVYDPDKPRNRHERRKLTKTTKTHQLFYVDQGVL